MKQKSNDLLNALLSSESELQQQAKSASQCDAILSINLESPQPINIQKDAAKIAPMLLTLKTKDIEDENHKRIGIDLICVIDVSGSMSGQPLKLVKESLKTLIDLMEPQDRVSLVTFSDKVELQSPLLGLNKENKDKMEEKINSFHSSGGTDIALGVEMAVKVLNARKQTNDVSYIFLLSDGNDNDPGTIKRVQSKIKNIKDVGIYTFGYGSDHDADIMSEISGVGLGGHYYFISKQNDVSEFFVMAIGGCASVFTWNSQVYIKPVYGKIIKIHSAKQEKDSNIWKVGALLFGREKQLIIEIEFNDLMIDENRVRKCLEVEFKGKEVAAGVEAKAKGELVCRFAFQEEGIQEVISEDLSVNYFIAKGKEKLLNIQEQVQKINKESDSDNSDSDSSDSDDDENDNQIDKENLLLQLEELKNELQNFEYKNNPKLKQLKKGIKIQFKLLKKSNVKQKTLNQGRRCCRQMSSCSASRSRSNSVSSIESNESSQKSRSRSRQKKEKESHMKLSLKAAQKTQTQKNQRRSRSRSRSSSRNKYKRKHS